MKKILTKLKVNDNITPLELTSSKNETVLLPNPEKITHIQFRRFAGCPICNLHIQSVMKAKEEIENKGIAEVIVFHSTLKELQLYADDIPFPTIADAEKKLYHQFGVDKSVKSLLNPPSWPGMFGGVFYSLWETIKKGKRIPPVNATGGSFGLPADFLISPQGKILAVKYGTHADDQWSVSEILQLADRFNNK
ncbi:AhpC/TSA family protein [Flavobacterium alkalisoli]|uniref:AhpC/TSA family protein n=1 Tax=Flavobacterium alkalisoli TaxID=2602769 RepID=A0A5B9FTG8_9FLAO|nr:peroxiredoxin-like family protein [Flavobacterium alkalisoli]QEE48958.1 AhpC/TSA family protein [Flavobacterium alkalisoli]